MPSRPVIVVTGPSGAGKGTLIRGLVERVPGLEIAVSATTRQRRPGETDGNEYWFLSDDEFTRRIDTGDFLEWVSYVSGRRYGTLRSEIDRFHAARKRSDEAISGNSLTEAIQILESEAAAENPENWLALREYYLILLRLYYETNDLANATRTHTVLAMTLDSIIAARRRAAVEVPSAGLESATRTFEHERAAIVAPY